MKPGNIQSELEKRQLRNMCIWIVIISIAAAGAGMYFYNLIEQNDSNQALSIDDLTRTDNQKPDDSQTTFSVFEIPRTMPEFKFLNPTKKVITLDAFQGRVVLLNIWATWCIPCREEMPALDRLQAELGEPEFEVVALSIDRGESFVIETFYKELGLDSLAIYHDPTGSASYKLNVPGIPATFLINHEGKALGTVIGPIEWDSPEVVNEIKSYLSRDIEVKIL